MRRTFWLLPVLAPQAAWAHPGHDAALSFLAGLSHPLGGADHVLAMVALGLWAAIAGGSYRWAAPSAFVAAMLAGGALTAAGPVLPAVEPVILASVIVLGAAAALALRPPLAVAIGLLALFGMAHGAAHAVEGAGAAFLPYAAGFVAATAALHLAGLGLGQVARTGALRLAGLAGALGGVALALAG